MLEAPLKEHDDVPITQYLLGRLKDEDCSRFEERLVADDDLLDRVSEIEQELIRDYLRGDLSWWERRRFRRRLRTSPDLQEKTAAASALKSALSGGAGTATPSVAGHPGQARYPTFRLAAVGAILLLCALTWVVDDLRVRRSLNALRIELAEKVQNPLPAFLFTLSPGTTKATQSPRRLLVTGNGGLVRLRVEIPNPSSRYPQYRASIRTVDGDHEVWSGVVGIPEWTPSGALADADVPVASLAANDYILLLWERRTGGEWQEVESYSFGVIRQ